MYVLIVPIIIPLYITLPDVRQAVSGDLSCSCSERTRRIGGEVGRERGEGEGRGEGRDTVRVDNAHHKVYNVYCAHIVHHTCTNVHTYAHAYSCT